MKPVSANVQLRTLLFRGYRLFSHTISSWLKHHLLPSPQSLLSFLSQTQGPGWGKTNEILRGQYLRKRSLTGSCTISSESAPPPYSQCFLKHCILGASLTSPQSPPWPYLSFWYLLFISFLKVNGSWDYKSSSNRTKSASYKVKKYSVEYYN